jgi:hypothetical protein
VLGRRGARQAGEAGAGGAMGTAGKRSACWAGACCRAAQSAEQHEEREGQAPHLKRRVREAAARLVGAAPAHPIPAWGGARERGVRASQVPCSCRLQPVRQPSPRGSLASQAWPTPFAWPETIGPLLSSAKKSAGGFCAAAGGAATGGPGAPVRAAHLQGGICPQAHVSHRRLVSPQEQRQSP